MSVFKVSTNSNPSSIAGALAHCLRDHKEKEVEISAIGAGAVNQGIKAIAIARGFVAPNGIELVCIPAFEDTKINGEERTTIKLIVKCVRNN